METSCAPTLKQRCFLACVLLHAVDNTLFLSSISPCLFHAWGAFLLWGLRPQVYTCQVAAFILGGEALLVQFEKINGCTAGVGVLRMCHTNDMRRCFVKKLFFFIVLVAGICFTGPVHGEDERGKTGYIAIGRPHGIENFDTEEMETRTGVSGLDSDFDNA